MEILHSWITTLIAAVLITNFLEMLLPESDLRKFVKVVLGIFIIVTILHPLLNLVHQNINFEHIMLKASGQEADSVEDILAKGKQFKQVTGNIADEQYTEGLNRQIRALALLVNGVADAKAEVKLEKKVGGASSKIGTVKVLLKTKGIFSEQQQLVKPIDVKISSAEKERNVPAEKADKVDKHLTKAVQETVANFYNLSLHQVEAYILD